MDATPLQPFETAPKNTHSHTTQGALMSPKLTRHSISMSLGRPGTPHAEVEVPAPRIDPAVGRAKGFRIVGEPGTPAHHMTSLIVVIQRRSPLPHTPAHVTQPAHTVVVKASLAIQAIRFHGKAAIGDKEVRRLRKVLSANDRLQFLRRARYNTGWVADIARKVAEGTSDG